MITNQLRLEAYNSALTCYELPARNIRVSKNFFGGEDMALSFDLDRDPRINYRDVAYGNDVILRRGLNPVFKGEMRSITQGEETLTIGCPGQWIYLDDANAGDEQRIWCDSRYKRWQEINPVGWVGGADWAPQKYSLDNNNRIYIAPRKGEQFAGAVPGDAGWCYWCSSNEIARISFDYSIDLDWTTDWEVYVQGRTAAGAPGTFWAPAAGTVSAGVKDVPTLVGGVPCAYVQIWMRMTPAVATIYTGETGVSVFAIFTNLRLWGQSTESHSSIHVMEAAIDQVAATTPIDASHDLALEEMPVRDRFTDANGTLLTAHLPDKDELRGGWTALLGGYDIQTNQANCTVIGRAVIDSGISDGVVTADVRLLAAGNHGTYIVFRAQDNLNYWVWGVYTDGHAYLQYDQAGAATTVFDLTLGVERNYWYNLMVKLRGDRIDCYLGGVWRCGTNNSFLQTQTRHGIRDASSIAGRHDNFEVFQMLPLWPLFYEEGESCYGAVKDAASFGDWNCRALGWGIEAGGDRAFLRVANRQGVRYVIPAQFCRQLSARGETQGAFYTSGWARYIDEEGIQRFTAKYYVHVTNAGLVINTTATGNDLASVVYGVARDHTFDFGRVDANLAIEYLIQSLMEQGHPKVQTSIEVFGPVKDLHRGGALIEPIEMEMGYLVQIPWFRATEAEGAAATDIRDFDTTFLMVGMEVDVESGVAKLIPEGAQEDLQRMIKAARAVVEQDEKRLTSKRSRVVGG